MLDRNIEMCDNCEMMQEYVRNEMARIEDEKRIINQKIEQNERSI